MGVPHSQDWTGRFPHPRSVWGTPHPGQVPGQDRGLPWGTPPHRTGLGCPHPGLDGVPLCWDWMDGVHTPPPIQVRSGSRSGWGVAWDTPPCPELDGVSPPNRKTEQHSEHLLRGGRYASCVYSEGLSCL